MNVLKKWHKHFLKLSSAVLILSGAFLCLGKKPPITPPSFRRIEINRKEIHKNLYLDQGEKPLHSHLFCESSVLHITPLIEKMENVEAVLHYKDEERHFLAPKGTYNYKTQTFEANSLDFAFYKEPSSPFLEGVAEQVTLLIEKTPHFKAANIEAKVKLE